jgi:hypothetical protein
MRTAYTDEVARRLRCAVPQCGRRSVPHHVRTKGRQGQVDPGNVAPLCWHHHEEGHRIGWRTFAKKYRVCLPGEALLVLARMLRHPPPPRMADEVF